MFNWTNPQVVTPKRYRCANCDSEVAAAMGYATPQNPAATLIAICPNCGYPTFHNGVTQFPSASVGRSVAALPAEVAAAYEEARKSLSSGCSNACTLLLRRLLMFLAVEHGASEGQTFVEYITHLEKSGYVPPGAKTWLDKIRTRGNDATHRLPHVESVEAQQLLDFAEMLLRFMYEFPSKLGKTAP